MRERRRRLRGLLPVIAAAAIVTLAAIGLLAYFFIVREPPPTPAPIPTPTPAPTSVPAVAAVRVQPEELLLAEGQMKQIDAEALDAEGEVLPGREIEWSSSDEDVVRVTDTGMLVAVSPGSAMVTVAAEGRQASASVAVVRTRSRLGVGESHNCYISGTGDTYCWGKGDNGRLGGGAVTSQAAPGAVAGTPSLVSVSAGAWHTCGITAGLDATAGGQARMAAWGMV